MKILLLALMRFFFTLKPAVLLSALLIVFAFPPWDIWPLIFFALVGWLWSLDQAKTLKEAFFNGFWMSVLMTLGGYHWVAYAVKTFGALPWAAGITALLIFSIIGQLQFYVFSAAYFVLRKRVKKKVHSGILSSILFVLTLTLLYTGIDWLLPKLFVDTMGHSLYLANRLRQIADLGTPYLLTALIFFVNFTLKEVLSYFMMRTTSRPSSETVFSLSTTAIILMIASLIYGQLRIDQVQRAVHSTDRRLHLAAIQAAIGDFDKVAAEKGLSGAVDSVMDTYISLSEEALLLNPKPDVIMWPETAYPSTFPTPRSFVEFEMKSRVKRFVRENNIPLYFGGYDHSEGKDFNAFFLLNPDGSLSTYQKSILLLMGEYIPGADWFPIIKRFFPEMGFFGRGEGAKLLTLSEQYTSAGTVRISPTICYEILFTSLLVDAARLGSEFILNVSNDSWFGTFGEPQLHLALTTFRTIETRLPMLRLANTGISTLVDATGEMTQKTGIGDKTILNTTIHLTPPIPTLVKSLGDWFGPTALALSLISLYFFLGKTQGVRELIRDLSKKRIKKRSASS